MGRAKSLGLIATFVILWVSSIAYPALFRVDAGAHRPERQPSAEPGLFFPLMGAWTLPESPILRLSPGEDLRGRP